MPKQWRPYELLIPLRFNDGRPVPSGWLGEAVQQIVDRVTVERDRTSLGGFALANSPQNQGATTRARTMHVSPA